jgi:predicted oxidoreductase
MSISRIWMSNEGPECSRLAWGLGSLPMSYTSQQVLEMLDICLEAGITTIDNAENYGGFTREQLLGQALAGRSSLRDQLQLITKFGCVGVTPRYPNYQMYQYDTTRAHIIEAAETSLVNFGTDRLDALLIHRPDPLMDADEVAEAFTGLRQAGKVLHFGVSNFSPAQFELLASRLAFPLVTNEVQFSVLHHEPWDDGTLDLCQRRRISPMAWGPLGRGHLFTGSSERIVTVRQVLQKVGDELGGASISQVALAWVLKHPARIIPILGTGIPSEMRSTVQAESLSISRQQWYAIWEAGRGERLP